MKFFDMLHSTVHITPDTKRIPREEFSALLTANELIEKIEEETIIHRENLEKERREVVADAKDEGYADGLAEFNEQLKYLEEAIHTVREEMQTSIVPLALTAVKKIIGKELELNPNVVVDIVRSALKPVSQHRKITIYVNKGDFDLLDEERERIKEVFEHLETLSIKVRDDVAPSSCIIETEAGIINAQLDSQLGALEAAFHSFFDSHKSEDD